MNHATNHDDFPPLISGILTDPITYIDNVFADGWKQLNINSLISRAGLKAQERGATMKRLEKARLKLPTG